MNVKPADKKVLSKLSQKHLIGFAAAATAVIAISILVIASNLNKDSTLPELRNVFTLYDEYNMTVVVVFDIEPPIVQLIAPNGRRVDMDNIRYRTGSNFIQYFLPNAMPGTWQMAYDPLSNTEINTPYSVYMEHIFIRDFEVQETDENGNIPTAFVVSADEPGEFSYEIHTVFTAPDNSIADEILLVKGYGLLNEELRLTLDGNQLQDMGGFMLRLTAYVQHGQAAIRDTAWLDLRLR